MLGDLPAAAFFAPRRALIPDMLGYGAHASVAPGTISLQAQADDIAAQVRRAGHSRAHIVGHSVGGAVAMLLARRHPQIAASVINVEGNFTLQDAFWTGKLANMTLAEVEGLLQSYRGDVSGWLTRAGMGVTPERAATAGRGLRTQPAATVKAVAQSVIATTAEPAFLEDVRAVLDSGTPVHLFAGERSRAGWHVPAWVVTRAASMTVQLRVGHMMMLEEPEEFLRLVARLIN